MIILKKIVACTCLLLGLLAQAEAAKNKITRVPMPNQKFVGRSKELLEIRESLSHPKATLAVIGLPGVGKTQLIKEYTHRSKSQYELTWWFDASSPLLPQFVQLAHEWNKGLTDPNKQISQAAMAGPAIVEVVKEALLKDQKNWLLIFDNAQHIDLLIKDFAPREGDGTTRQHIIITSKKNTEWKNVLKVNPFARSESLALLKEFFGEAQHEESDYDALSETFGDMPVSLVRVATHIQLVPSLSLPKYIDIFRKNHKMLEKLEQQIMVTSQKLEYERTFSSAMGLTLVELERTSPISHQFLLFLAFIDHKNISESLIVDWLKNNDQDADLIHEIIYSLTAHFLIEKTFDTDESPYEIHQLLQDTMRRLISPENQQLILQGAGKLFLTYLAQDTWEVSEVLSKSPALYDHMKKFFNHIEHPSEQEGFFMTHLFHAALFYKGDAGFADVLLKKIEELLKADILKLQGFDLARFLNTRGKFSFANDLKQAIEDTQEACAILKSIKGDPRINSEFFLATVNNLTDYYLIQGAVHEAKKACEAFKDTLANLDQKIYGTLYYSFLALCEM